MFLPQRAQRAPRVAVVSGFISVGSVTSVANASFAKVVRPHSGAANNCMIRTGGVRCAQTTGYRLGSRRDPVAISTCCGYVETDAPEGMQEGSRGSSRSGAPPEREAPMRDGPGGIADRCFCHRGLRGHRGLGWSLFLSVDSVTSVANDSFAMRCASVGGGVRLRDPYRWCSLRSNHWLPYGIRCGIRWPFRLAAVMSKPMLPKGCEMVAGGCRAAECLRNVRAPRRDGPGGIADRCFCHRELRGHEGCSGLWVYLCGLGDLCGK
ncbi:hypothetical protein Poly24_55020 [Rosistilla carotiformis]|uniref:Uncharacterized protein n=1 Tax=Rosistilla carotiformis TaxID=2528017 RepID=A0A518K1W0_9BACT|nr:hypothetical protein Poly24_55020 [Rosistilla carotiformis]